ncbi:DoxX family protein [Actinoplanes sp. NPDC051513]|uniref:DoxX family protein n=1 Tax=Actinoplanes sp. NPDC051513 TaxID=3363908 RepID=UPI0037B324D6
MLSRQVGMNIILWIVAAALAAAFLASGVLKLVWSRERLAAAGMGWATRFSARSVKGIGVLEILAAVGLVVPAALGIAPVLAPLAATGLVLLMAGAIVTHLRRREMQPVAINLVFLGLSAFVAWSRFF